MLGAMLFRRFDGRPARDVPAYRRMVPFLMRRKNESSVYFSQTLDVSATLPWIADWNRDRDTRITVFHVVLAAMTRVLDERPRLNRFVSGRRIYQRNGVYISFAAKKRMDDEAPLALVKRRFEPGERFADMVAALSGDVNDARSDRRSVVDRELGLLLRLPAPAIAGAVRLLSALDRYNLAPRALLENDPMYTSVFVANLGSLAVDAAYHHLYEYGNCPLFVTIGKLDRAARVTANDAVCAGPVLELKFTYDERIEDGLYCARALERFKEYVENPAWLGES